MTHRYGQFPVAEPLHHLTLIHRHRGETLKEVDHEPPLAVLEQENFSAQGIDTSSLGCGAPRVDALGNCVYNAGTAAVSCLGATRYTHYLHALTVPIPADLFADGKAGEEAAIVAYHLGTDLTGSTSTEWPPTDCGSSGVYLVNFLQRLGIVASQKIAHGAQDLVSLLQHGGVLQGGPFLNAWEEPGPGAMVDGDGSMATLEDQIRSGVAGGHETYISAIEKLSLSATGVVEPQGTVLRVRNSWGRGWGDHGSFRIHLSTLVALGSYFDWRQLVV